MPDRRTVLSLLAAAGAALLRPPRVGARDGVRDRGEPLERIGLQLYTVRRLLADDFDGTLAAVRAVGYREVEFAGYAGRSPAQVRAALERHGLAAPSAHVGWDRLDDWSRTLDQAADAGHRWVVIPWVPPDARRSADAWRRIAERLDRAGEAARAAGLRLGYHNHAFEFEPVDGLVPYDLLLDGTRPELVAFELDVYWAARAGADPVGLLRRAAARTPMLHLKDSTGAPAHTMTDVGRGRLDFAAILAAGCAAGLRHAFVEHDQPADPYRSIRTSYAAVAALAC